MNQRVRRSLLASGLIAAAAVAAPAQAEPIANSYI
jgi:hypothetical protein